MDSLSIRTKSANTHIEEASAMALYADMVTSMHNTVPNEGTVAFEAMYQNTEMQIDEPESCDETASGDDADDGERSNHAFIDDESNSPGIDEDSKMNMNEVIDEEADEEEVRNRVHDHNAANIDFHCDGYEQNVSRDSDMTWHALINHRPSCRTRRATPSISSTTWSFTNSS